MSKSPRSPFRAVGTTLFVVLFGIPLFLLSILFTYGAILIPLFGFFLIAPFVALNYALWGWCSAFKPVERESMQTVGECP